MSTPVAWRGSNDQQWHGFPREQLDGRESVTALCEHSAQSRSLDPSAPPSVLHMCPACLARHGERQPDELRWAME